MHRQVCIALALALGVSRAVLAQEELSPEDLALFEEDILPILEENCFKCHGGGDEIEGGLMLTSRAGLLRGGNRGPVVDRDAPESSLLLEMISYSDEDHEMPPDGKLLPWDTDALTDWVLRGSPWPGDAGDASDDVPLLHGMELSDPELWAFRPVERPRTPGVAESSWAENPIDAFIYAGLREAGLEPAPPASKSALIRRVFYDLTGLPPTPEEVQAFVEDDDPEAYGRLIERLLDSPRYGEKWGRHWLDLVHYADSNGYERDSDKPHIWRYRDYVIEAFNQDKPYDEFIMEQLAGDELADRSNESLIATGFFRLGLWDDEPGDPLLARFDNLDDMVDTTGKVFLGLTLGCARCHDHKLDPITQEDYYRFVAFYQGVRMMKRTPGNGIVRSIMSPSEERRHGKQVERKREREASLREDLRDILSEFKAEVQRKRPDLAEEDAIASLKNGGKTKITDALKALFEEHGESVVGAKRVAKYERVQADLERVQSETAPGRWAACVGEDGPEPEELHLLIRGNPHAPGKAVTPGFPGVFGESEPPMPSPYGSEESSGRRRQLAEWIASPANPLTARVMVNRVWQYHFGRGIVSSSNNFGAKGRPPTHPELLDWLASEFVRDGWRLKSLHKLILISKTYRMSSRGDAEGLAKDPANALHGRFDMQRLTAEEVRDSLLAASGTLNAKMFGPGVYPPMPEEVLATSSKQQEIISSGIWGVSSPEESARRSVYIHVKRSLLTPLLTDFDFADTDASCPVRFSTTLPTQALGMLNSAFVHEQSALMAGRVRSEVGSDIRAQVRRVLEVVTSRPASEDEVAQGLEFIGELEREESVDRDRALDRFCLLAFNLNEFLYLD